MCLRISYVIAQRLSDVVDRVLDLVEMVVDVFQRTPNERMVGGILPAGSFDECSREACHHDAERGDDCDQYALTHGRSSPRT